jgi:molecular chaperone GrpE
VAEAKREEERVIPIDGVRGEREAESSQASDDSSSADPPASLEASLAAELQTLKAEKDELMQTMIRRQADFENFRKRTERDRFEEGRRGVERLVVDLIPVLDAFDLALQAHDDPAYEEYRKGITLIRKQLWDSIAKHGVQRIEAAGKMFDPNMHQAIERLETEEFPDGFIVAVFQDGYMFNGRVLRPAIVRVAVNSGEGESPITYEN